MTIDSDVMLFTDPIDIFNRYCQYDMTLSKLAWAGSSIWKNPDTLMEFCRFCWEIYSFPECEKSKEIFSHYDKLHAAGLPGGVCDMTLCEHFAKCYDFKIADTSIPIKNHVIDHNILVEDGYDYKDGHKVFGWENGRPYSMFNKEKIWFDTIHLSQTRNIVDSFAKKYTEKYNGN
jgi:hypothetical protein